MSNWYGTARSNYVCVRDREAFLAWVDTLADVTAIEKDGAFALFADTDDGGWPTFRDAGGDEVREIDLATEIAAHLASGEVFIFQEIGAEKRRYLTGWATAVNSAGETLHVSIGDIYERVRAQWKVDLTEATY